VLRRAAGLTLPPLPPPRSCLIHPSAAALPSAEHTCQQLRGVQATHKATTAALSNVNTYLVLRLWSASPGCQVVLSCNAFGLSLMHPHAATGSLTRRPPCGSATRHASKLHGTYRQPSSALFNSRSAVFTRPLHSWQGNACTQPNYAIRSIPLAA
jgi:hypothetical protein